MIAAPPVSFLPNVSSHTIHYIFNQRYLSHTHYLKPVLAYGCLILILSPQGGSRTTVDTFRALAPPGVDVIETGCQGK